MITLLYAGLVGVTFLCTTMIILWSAFQFNWMREDWTSPFNSFFSSWKEREQRLMIEETISQVQEETDDKLFDQLIEEDIFEGEEYHQVDDSFMLNYYFNLNSNERRYLN